VREYGPKLLATIRRLCSQEEDAREAFQDAMLSVVRSVAGFQAGSRLSTWLHRIAINAALMKLRRHRRRPEKSIDELLPRYLDDGHQQASSVQWAEPASGPAERRELRALVRQSIDRLPDSYRTVLLLRDIEELGTAETAELLGITSTAVKVRLHRARQALRTVLDPHFREAVP
jgi:RNA polymerase sigma-70 factor (ECF subfamily)